MLLCPYFDPMINLLECLTVLSCNRIWGRTSCIVDTACLFCLLGPTDLNLVCIIERIRVG